METMTQTEAYKAAQNMIKHFGWSKAAVVERETCHYGEYGLEYDVAMVDALPGLYEDGWELVMII